MEIIYSYPSVQEPVSVRYMRATKLFTKSASKWNISGKVKLITYLKYIQQASSFKLS